LLTSGDLGWIHKSNMLLVGVLTALLAVGVGRMLRTGRGAVWGPRHWPYTSCTDVRREATVTLFRARRGRRRRR
jgi:hypothetical protein